MQNRMEKETEKTSGIVQNGPMTMKDIARELGISVATVSRALKDSPRISEDRRQGDSGFRART